MTRANVGVWALLAGMTVACGGSREAEPQREGSAAAEPVSQEAQGRPAPIIETGCLTGTGNRFVLTGLQSAAGTQQATQQRTTTSTYQLVGMEDELRKHVGRQVRISGEAPPPQVAEVREATPSAQVGTAGQPSANAQVTTETQTRFEVTQLRVQSVTPTGDECTDTTGGTSAPR